MFLVIGALSGGSIDTVKTNTQLVSLWDRSSDLITTRVVDTEASV